MEIKNFFNDFSLKKKGNLAMLYSNSILATALAVSLYVNFQKDTIVINNLNESCQKSEISRTTMNQANHERLGFYVAGMLGNITPDTAEYVKGAVMPFISPTIYHEVKEALDIQIAGLVEDELTISFKPEVALYEDGTTYITGKGVIIGAAGDREGFTRTYEFDFEVQNYTPVAEYVTVYDDVAHDREWKRKHNKSSEEE
jgi:conjugal transfer pilus assembly protein TraE